METRDDMKIMDIAIWGTGKTADVFCEMFPDVEPVIYIDNRTDGEDTKNGIPIKRPSEGRICWEDLFIVVASEYYQEIAAQLNDLGMIEYQNYVYWREYQDIDPECGVLFRDMEQKFAQMIQKEQNVIGKTMLFFCLTKYDAVEKGLTQFIRRMDQVTPEGILFVQEAAWLTEQETENYSGVPSVLLPRIWGKGRYLKQNQLFVSRERRERLTAVKNDEMVEKVRNDKNLDLFARNLRGKFPDMLEGYEYVLVYAISVYTCEMLKRLRPTRVILWNEFYAPHGIVAGLCHEMGIEVKYMEFGNLSGNIQLDSLGQMGESWPAVHAEEFLALEVSEEEIKNAERVWKYLYYSKANRKKQPAQNVWSLVEDRIDLDLPIIVYAGQNDFESGIQPYTERTNRYHSPVFRSSDEAAVFLYELCRLNQWNFIYKPHPIMCRAGNFAQLLPEDMIVLKAADINETAELADVLVTILSTSAYVSLVRNKATLMLGYTQLKDKGCTYQAFSKDTIEEEIKSALQYGFTVNQKKAFLTHIAQLEKYYFYDDMKEKRYGFARDARNLNWEEIL